MEGEGMAKMKRVALILGGVALAGVTANLTLRAARRLLGSKKKVETQDGLIGQECLITTLEVSETFGQASLNDGGAGLILSVRSKQPNDLTRGGLARIVAYNASAGTYEVEVV